MLTILFFAVIVISATIAIFLNQRSFGKAPSGQRLQRIKNSPNFKNGKFQNQEITPQFAEDTSMPAVMYRILFGKKHHTRPVSPLRFTKTELSTLSPDENVYIWMGHSSYYLQLDGRRILVDPVFSGNASPVSFTTKAFAGTDLYSVSDIPELDYLIITHDHWDHLDYKTVTALQPKVNQVITGLGTGEHLEYWGYKPEQIIELDWGEKHCFQDGLMVFAETARHFSGRGLKRDRAIWASFVLSTAQHQIYVGGDSGFGKHFKKIGERYGGFDLAILENGQYNHDWRYIHMMPDEFLKAAADLNAKRIIPVHNSKFSLAPHPWKEPLETLSELNKKSGSRLITPKIGEKVFWLNDEHNYEKWWTQFD